MQDVNDGALQEQEAPALTSEEKEAVKSALIALYPLYEENKVPESVIASLGKIIGYPAPKSSEKVEKPYPSPYPGYPNVVKALEDLPNRSEVERLLQSITKSMEEEKKGFLEEIQKAQSRVAELEKVLSQERETREQNLFVNEVTSVLEPLSKHGGDKFVQSLFMIKKSLADQEWSAFFETLKKVNELVKAVPIMKELGSSVSETETPEASLAARAKVLVEKGLAKTIEQARAKVLEDDKGLYQALRGR